MRRPVLEPPLSGPCAALPTLPSPCIACAPPLPLRGALALCHCPLHPHTTAAVSRPRSAIEDAFSTSNAAQRTSILRLVCAFDAAMFALRAAAAVAGARPLAGLARQLLNMLLLYSAMAGLNARTRRAGSQAAKQVRGGRGPPPPP